MERRVAIEQALAHLPLMLTVEQTCQVLGIGRSLGYAQVRRYLASRGREGIPAVRIGTALRIPRAALVDLLLAAPAAVSAEPAVLQVVPAAAPPRPRHRRTGSRPKPSVLELPFASSD
jgi:hypothetical protein